MTSDQQEFWDTKNQGYLDHMDMLGKERLVVSAVIMFGDETIVVRRAPSDKYAGVWEFPGGGVNMGNPDDIHDDVAETVVDAIRREVFEETGIELPAHPDSELLVHETRTAIRVILKFVLPSRPNSVTLDPNEHDAHMFLNKDNCQNASYQALNVKSTMTVENQTILLQELGLMGLGR